MLRPANSTSLIGAVSVWIAMKWARISCAGALKGEMNLAKREEGRVDR